MANGPVYFETGFILIGSTRVDCEEITINSSKDSNPYYESGSKDASSIRTGRKRVEFTLRRAFSDNIFSKIYESDCEFTLLLFNNDLEEPQLVMAVQGCKLTSDNIGPVNGQDVVKQEAQGAGTKRVVSIDQIRTAIKNECTL